MFHRISQPEQAMAAWQADFDLRPDNAPLPADFRERLDALLPRAKSWSPELEMWGSESGNRIDIWPTRDSSGGEAMLRFDLREYDPRWGAQVLAVVHGIGRALWPVWSDGPVIRDAGELTFALRGSPAFRFVEDPEAFLRRVSLGGREDA